jgi:uncharacterized protein YcgI (DUF1989 family)
MTTTLWTYLPSDEGSLAGDRELYARLARETERRTLVDSFVIPIRSGRAWPVRAGQLCRVNVIEGPQVADFNAWNQHNPRERFWAARTKQLEASHVTTGNRLWSCLPYLRPMLTITNDTIAYGVDEDGHYFMKPSPAKKGDFFEFFAEIDLLCAISTCPGGDLSVPLWGPDAGDPLPTCKPLGVEIYQPTPELLTGWESPASASYQGNHGMSRPVFGHE